jgi:hypothetical protein
LADTALTLAEYDKATGNEDEQSMLTDLRAALIGARPKPVVDSILIRQQLGARPAGRRSRSAAGGLPAADQRQPGRPARPRGRSSRPARSFPWSGRSWPGLRRFPGAAGLATSAAERGLLDQELVPDVVGAPPAS